MNDNKFIFYIILGFFIIPSLVEFLFFVIIAIAVIFGSNPLFETATCMDNTCNTVGYYIIFSGAQNANQNVTDKSQLEIYRVSDNVSHINQYFIRMKNNPERYLFRTAYLTKRAADRDLINIQKNNNIVVTKRNTIFIQGFCITLYVILLIVGFVINRIRRYRNSHTALNIHNTEEQNGSR